MSAYLMGLVMRSELAGSELLVATALADHANDFGRSCHPSIKLLTVKTKLSDRRVQQVLQALAKQGVLTSNPRYQNNRQLPNEYIINVPWLEGSKARHDAANAQVLKRAQECGDDLAVAAKRTPARGGEVYCTGEADCTPDRCNGLHPPVKQASPREPSYNHNPHPSGSGGAPERTVPKLGGFAEGKAPVSATLPLDDGSTDAPAGRAHRLPSGFAPLPLAGQLAAEVAAHCEAAGVPVAGWLERELSKFRDYWSATAGARARMLDWQAAWRTWIRRSVDDRDGGRGGSGGRHVAGGRNGHGYGGGATGHGDGFSRAIERAAGRVFGMGGPGG